MISFSYGMGQSSRRWPGEPRLWGCARAVIATDGRRFRTGAIAISPPYRHRQRTASITAAKRTVDLYHTWLPTGTDAMVLSRGLVRKARVGIMDYLFSYRTCRLRHEQCTGTVGTEIEFVGVDLSVSSLVDLSLDLSPLAFVSGQ